MRIGVVTFPGSLDDRDAARAVRAVEHPVLPGPTARPLHDPGPGVDVVAGRGQVTTCASGARQLLIMP